CGSGSAPPGGEDAVDALQDAVDEQPGQADDEESEDDDVGLVEALGFADHAADTGKPVDGLGGDDGGVGHADRDAGPGDHFGERGGEDDPQRQPPGACAEGAGRVEVVGADVADRVSGGHGNGRQGGNDEQPDLGFFVDRNSWAQTPGFSRGVSPSLSILRH